MATFKVNVNLNNTPMPSGFDPLPPGEYICEVTEAEVKQSSKPGRSMIALRLRVQYPEDYAGRLVFDRRNLPIEGEDESHFVSQKLRELFESMPGVCNYETGEGDTDAMVGQTVCIITKNENRKGADGKPTGDIDTRVTKIYAPEAAAQAEAPAPPPPKAPQPPKKANAPAPAAPAKPPATTQRGPFRRAPATGAAS